MTADTDPLEAHVAELEALFHTATDEEWSQSVLELTTRMQSMTPDEVNLASTLLAEAAARNAAKTIAARLREQLPAATITNTTTLPDGLHLHELQLEGGDKVAVIAPTPAHPGEPVNIRRAVRIARTAALTGTCGECHGTLTPDATDPNRIAVTHAPDCPGRPERVQRLRGHAA